MKGTWNGPSLEESIGRKHLQKHEEREARMRALADHPPEPWERFRILIEAVKEGRQIIELVDHRARYALVALGVLNAAAFAFISRGHLLGSLSGSSKFWAIGLVLLYGALNLLFVLHAIDCLRPRPLRQAVPHETAEHPGPGLSTHLPLGILIWESVAAMDLASYHRAWDHAVMAQINGEAEAVFHTLARVIQVKYRALSRLYTGLAGLVVLAFVLLCLFTVLTLGA